MSCNFPYLIEIPSLKCVHQGKVRDTYTPPDHADLLLVAATDRISTHNKVHLSTIPNKGYALTALTVFWMAMQLKGISTHLVAYGKRIYDYLPDGEYPDDLHLRAIIVRKVVVDPVELIFRNRMAGSLWKDYYSKGLPNPYGFSLPTGLELMSQFEPAIFTPTDKSETDDPINTSETIQKYSSAYLVARKAYEQGRAYAATRGIEIIDGKFEASGIMLADECLTPDACRFVRAGNIFIGKEPTWMDKEHVRKEAERIWNGGPKVPLRFSDEICEETAQIYSEIVHTLTGLTLRNFQKAYLS